MQLPRQTKVDYKGPLDNSSSIQRVTYFSDGKTLNATLWVGGGINKNPSRDGASIVAYGILIDSDNNPATGLYGADYLKEIYWTNKPKTWNLLTAEYSSPINYRNLTIVKNYTEFSDNQKYVLMPISLKDITSPASYKVLYYAIVIYTQSKMLLDYTPWIDIPPTQYSFATSPNPVVVTQGEQQDIGVQLKSSNGISAKVVSFIPSQNYSAIKVLFNPDKLNASSFGIAPAPLRIEVMLRLVNMSYQF